MASRTIHQIRVFASLQCSMAVLTEPLLPSQPERQYLESSSDVIVFPSAVWSSFERFKFIVGSFVLTTHRRGCGNYFHVFHKCYRAFVRLHCREDLQNRFLLGPCDNQRLHIPSSQTIFFHARPINTELLIFQSPYLYLYIAFLLSCLARHLQLLQDRCLH